MPQRCVSDDDEDEDDEENETHAAPDLPAAFEPATIEKAQKVLEVFELATRNVNVSWRSAANRAHVGAHAALMSKLTFLRDSACSVKWAPGLRGLIDRAHSMRVRVIRESEKELVRQITGCCQVCGTKEHNCKYTFELLGSALSCVECNDETFGGSEDTNNGYSAKSWLTAKPGQLRFLYDDFMNGYNAIGSREWRRARRKESALPLEYLGMFAVGETCLHKVKMAFFVQNVPMELSYDAGEMLDAVGGGDKIGKRTYVSATKDNCLELLGDVEKVESALRRDNKNTPLPRILESTSLWTPIDELITKRAEASLQRQEVVELEDTEDEVELEEGEIGSKTTEPLRIEILKLCGRRANQNLNAEDAPRTKKRGKAPVRSEDPIEFGDSSEGGEEERNGKSKGRKRRRHAVVEDSDDGVEREDEDDHGFSKAQTEMAMVVSQQYEEAGVNASDHGASSSAMDAMREPELGAHVLEAEPVREQEVIAVAEDEIEVEEQQEERDAEAEVGARAAPVPEQVDAVKGALANLYDVAAQLLRDGHYDVAERVVAAASVLRQAVVVD